jgi:hypothetical protein
MEMVCKNCGNVVALLYPPSRWIKSPNSFECESCIHDSSVKKEPRNRRREAVASTKAKYA